MDMYSQMGNMIKIDKLTSIAQEANSQ